jgi:anti-anti-sigma factor
MAAPGPRSGGVRRWHATFRAELPSVQVTRMEAKGPGRREGHKSMTTHAVEEVVVLKPQGELWEGPECDELERQLEQLAGDGRQVVVDLAATHFLTARALGLLAHAVRSASLHGGRIALCGAAGFERWLLQLTHLAEALPVYASEDEAVRGLQLARARG